MNHHYPSDAQAKAEILSAGLKIYQRGRWPAQRRQPIGPSG